MIEINIFFVSITENFKLKKNRGKSLSMAAIQDSSQHVQVLKFMMQISINGKAMAVIFVISGNGCYPRWLTTCSS